MRIMMYNVSALIFVCAILVTQNQGKSITSFAPHNTRHHALEFTLFAKDGEEQTRKVYYISATTETPDTASWKCATYYGGQLLTIQNHAQEDAVLTQLTFLGVYNEHFWTAGRQNGSTWFWSTTGYPIQSSQLYWHSPSSQNHGDFSIEPPDRCLSLVLDDDGYGACSSFQCSQYFRYICET